MDENECKSVAAEGFVSIKEAAHILHISPKTVYNKLWRGEFPLKPFHLPWNKRDLFFDRGELLSMAAGKAHPEGSAVARLLESIRAPLRPVLVALHGSEFFEPCCKSCPMLSFVEVGASRLKGWWRRFDLLLVQQQRVTISLAAATAEHFRAAALLAAVVAVRTGD